jgi:hypothetical protein
VSAPSSANAGSNPEGDEVSAQTEPRDVVPVWEAFPAWLGGMTQEEAGLTLTLVTRA